MANRRDIRVFSNPERVGALIMGWRFASMLQSIEGVK